MIRKLKYHFALVLILSTCTQACNPDNPVDDDNPQNLEIEIIQNEESPGLLEIIATASNAIEYKLFINNSTDPVLANSTGIFEWTIDHPGFHSIEVRAYGASGKYIKESRQVEIISENGVTLEDGYISASSYTGYHLVWNDEFDGTSVNSENWVFETGTGCPNCGWGNNELQYYRRENTSVSDGVLTIEARKEEYQSSSYTSSRLKTQGLKSFKYGRIDIRALLPRGQGIWPALWMLGNNIETVSWPDCGEIDIMEMVGGENGDNTVHGTAHWNYNGDHAQSGSDSKLPRGTYADEYHVFSIIWDSSSIKWYMNDEHFYTLAISSADMSAFHKKFFFIFNLAVGGNWPGAPDNSTIFPQSMKVDYIRVFQKD